MRENLLELVGEILVLRFEVVNYPIFVFNVTLQFFNLMLETADLVLVDIFQFLDFSLSGAFHALCLGFDESVVFCLFCLPSSQTFFCFSS